MHNKTKRLVTPLMFGAIALLANACGQGSTPKSETKVTNGVAARETEFPAVVLLVMEGPEGQGLCTGTFVNQNQVITAGHCVEGLDPTNPKIYFVKTVAGKAIGVQAQSFKRNPLYSMQDRGGINPHDVSVVTFPPASAPAVATLAARTPAVKSKLTIVGYGNNRNFLSADGQFNGSGAGAKRQGQNVLAEASGGFLSFIGVSAEAADLEAGELVSAGSGDSGGPMFVDNQLVGVTSGGGLVQAENDMLLVVSQYVDLNSAEIRAFLKQELR